jgi:hypothetical protein
MGLLEHSLGRPQDCINSPTTLRPPCCQEDQPNHMEKLFENRCPSNPSHSSSATRHKSEETYKCSSQVYL